MSFKEIRYPNAEKELKELLENYGVEGGYFENSLTEDGESLAQVAFQNEMGRDGEENRPFMSRAAVELEKEAVALYQKEAKKTGYTAEKMMKKMGLLIIAAIKKQIRTAKSWARPNSPETIEAKGSDAPLVDTGFMLKSPDYRGRK